MVKLNLTADINEQAVISEIVKALSRKINSVFTGMQTDGVLRSELGDFAERQIRNSPEFDSLLSGELKAAFGLIESATILGLIISTVKRNIFIDATPVKVVGAVISASLTVGILLDDFQDVLALPGTAYSSNGGEVRWLEWLLVKGDSIVISNYSLKVDVGNTTSRTGDAIMVKSNRGFRVPPEYAGGVSNNWLTRCFEETEGIVGNILRLDFIRRFV